MASICRSALKLGARSIANVRSKTPIPKPLPPSSTRSSFCASRVSVALASVESLMPLHSAIASSRLKSNLAFDSSCWSWLSQDFAIPR